ncbi:MAG: flagellar hook-associated protein 3 [Thermodesulfovibrio sp. RBG_19FT_COMBO_42_12]|nr:MAG: flagellar hook-associated protein 3 [Thermodesulfovibrio sp. RBG_19FT_COMBO_42_12]
MSDTVMGNMQRNLEKLLDLQNSASSGKKINKPSDDPAGAARVINYNSAISKAGQYQRNIDNGAAYLNATETAISATQDIFLRAKELALSALSETSSAADRNTMAMEVEQLYEQVRQIANTKYDNRYIFAGLKTDVAPYDNTGSYTGTASNGGYIDVEIDAGITMSVNMPGYAVFGSATDGTDVLAALSDLKTAMESNDTVAIEGAMTNLDSGMDQVSDALSYIGARLNRLDIAKNHFDTLLFDLAKYKSDTEDADITNIISQLALQETMLEVSRATAAKVLQQSILDFMR